jgi:transcriptional regulator with XRE-family HTH domain
VEEKLISWGKTFEEYRFKLKLTQFELAEITKLSDLTIRNIEKGKASVAIGNWLKVADVLGIAFEMSFKKMSDETRKSI